MSGGIRALCAQAPYIPRLIAPPPGYMEAAEKALAEPFKGITTDGTVVPGLFSIQKTGLSTTTIKDAAAALLTSLTPQQQATTLFPADSDEWRLWSNIHRYPRQGFSLAEMHSTQRERAFGLLKEGLSPKGFAIAQDIMRLNETVAELTGKRDEYGEGLYWFTIMGTPSTTEPWGWQLDGHHLVINYFILGDQLVMTPTFMGSEPVRADSGKYAGTRVFEVEEANGLKLMRALASEQREKAILSKELPREIFTAAFRDNFEMQYAGLRYGALSSPQQALLLGLIESYIGNIRPGHAEVRMAEVKQHLGKTYFAWMGGVDEDSVFYYRVHSPVILIEFDHQRGIALGNERPSRNHIHTVVRTPNGNDYGKDLLRQHHQQFDHTRSGHGHPR
ncbi:MAG: DUF3500 domain-containing protein [Candidatus Entotheonellia bacterium]